MRRILSITVLTGLLVGLSACEDDTMILDERTVTRVGQSGGAARSADGQMTLSFPAGALAQATEIEILTVRDRSYPRLASLAYELGPDGTQFSTPVSIVIQAESSSERLAIANLDGPYPELLEDSVHDPATNTVRASLRHFSSYGVVTVYNPCANKGCGDGCSICDPLDTGCIEPPPSAKACNVSGLCVSASLAACMPTPDAGVVVDAGTSDLGSPDSGSLDMGSPADSGVAMDSGSNLCTDTFTQNPQPVVDILLVVDNSGSMADSQSQLAMSFPLLQTTLTMNNVDFQIGVTTTDDRVMAGALMGTPPILTSSTTGLATAFANNVQVGIRGSPIERGLETGRLALNNTSSGLLRPNSSITVIYVSDEDDGSPDPTSDYINALVGIRGPRRIQANAIVGDVPGGCPGASAGARYDAVRAATNGVFSSICGSNYGPALTSLGGPGFGYLFEFELAQMSSSIQSVTVGGASVPSTDWTYDPMTATISFAETAVPGPSATIEVKSVCGP